ncbi:hypothetical protein [Microlunatus speluncae]|uniref:hypothetical protein n=1 Tax=Microlunatus speluncae TaxID=2594267 RepID=UPI001266472C|nr:hypothetical protein [Microlunatus speluncae]
MWVDWKELEAQIVAQHPGFGPAEIARSAEFAVSSAAAFHGLLLALCALLVAKLATSRARVRQLTSVSQLLSAVFSLVSWFTAPMFHLVIPIGLAQVIVLGLLRIPRTSRRFFTGG